MIYKYALTSLIGLLVGLFPSLIEVLYLYFGYLSPVVNLLISGTIAILSHYVIQRNDMNDKGLNGSNFRHALFLGLCSSFSIVSIYLSQFNSIFWIYIIQLCFFHWSEFFLVSFDDASNISTDYYMLNHSTEYKIALLLSIAEYWIEKWLFPTYFVNLRFLSYIGLTISILGELLRKVSLWTAGKNFSHYIELYKREDHVLVQSGVYRLFRHPSYVGWFYFSIGTQLALLNPICFIGYAIASWNFFNRRIYDEEQTLIVFFGESYIKYQKEVGTGLPYIKGYVKSE